MSTEIARIDDPQEEPTDAGMFDDQIPVLIRQRISLGSTDTLRDDRLSMGDVVYVVAEVRVVKDGRQMDGDGLLYTAGADTKITEITEKAYLAAVKAAR